MFSSKHGIPAETMCKLESPNSTLPSFKPHGAHLSHVGRTFFYLLLASKLLHPSKIYASSSVTEAAHNSDTSQAGASVKSTPVELSHGLWNADSGQAQTPAPRCSVQLQPNQIGRLNKKKSAERLLAGKWCSEKKEGVSCLPPRLVASWRNPSKNRTPSLAMRTIAKLAN